MRTSKRVVAVVIGLLLIAPLGGPSPARADVVISVSFFYDALSPYGEWIETPRFGLAWHPTRVWRDWRPYAFGRWIYCDYGWTFVSNEPWAWATYHYGRWYLDPFFGWIWVPGTIWGPSWVVFFEADHWIGWAPLAPGVRDARSYRPDPRSCSFVAKRRFLEPRVDRWLAPRERNPTLVRASANVTRYARDRDGYDNRSFSVDRIARVTGQSVPMRRVVSLDAGRGRPRVQLGTRELGLFRPRISGRPTHPPRSVRRPRPHGDAPHARKPHAVRPHAAPKPHATVRPKPANKPHGKPHQAVKPHGGGKPQPHAKRPKPRPKPHGGGGG